jgi:tetratricopeptide (TPR) repeat protein
MKKNLRALSIALAQVCVVVALIAVPFFAAQAQVAAKNKFGKEERKFPNVSESFGKKITEASGFLQPVDPKVKPNPTKAKQLLAEMEANQTKTNAYEKALLHQYYGYAYLATEDYQKAIDSFNKMLALSPNMPVATEASTTRIVGQLYSQVENPKKALETMIKWTDYVAALKPEDHYIFATLYYQLEDNKNALLNINEAIKNQEALGKIPSESWYLLQRGMYFDKEDYKNGVVSLEKLIKYYPKPSYWKQLSQVYFVMERPKESLNAMDVSYIGGGLTTEKDVVRMATMFLSEDMPYQAAKVMKKGIYTDKVVEPTAKNLKLLADSLRVAQEAKESLVEYEKAAQKSSDDGEMMIGLAQTYLANDKYKEAAKWGRQALKAGGIKRVDLANVLVAQSEFELKNYDEAIRFFREAGKDARSTKMSEQWINFVNTEKTKAEMAKQG